MELFLVRVFFSVQWLSYIISNELVKPLTKSKYIGKVIYNWPSSTFLKRSSTWSRRLLKSVIAILLLQIYAPITPIVKDSHLAIGIVLLVCVISILLMLCCANGVCSPPKIMKKRRRNSVSLPGTTIISFYQDHKTIINVEYLRPIFASKNGDNTFFWDTVCLHCYPMGSRGVKCCSSGRIL